MRPRWRPTPASRTRPDRHDARRKLTGRLEGGQDAQLFELLLLKKGHLVPLETLGEVFVDEFIRLEEQCLVVLKIPEVRIPDF